MFVGSINADLRALLAEMAPAWKDRQVYVGCSGNLTVERVLTQAGVRAIHGNDVSLYSCVLGQYAAGVTLTPTLKPGHEWLEPYLTPGVPTIATLLLLMEYYKFAGRAEAYHRRMAQAYESQWAALHAGSCSKIDHLLKDVHLATFTPGDVVPFFEAVPEDAVVVSFPPTYCLEQRHRVLTADLRWVPVGDIKKDDRLLAFEEHPAPGMRCRRWQFSTVLRADTVRAECVRVILANGDEVVCTADHPWLADRTQAMYGSFKAWVRADQLGGKFGWVSKLLDPWSAADSYEAGWLAGLFDGEGTIARSGTTRGVSWNLGIAQKLGPVLDRVVAILERDGFQVGVHGNRQDDVRHAMVNGGFGEVIRALGTYRPLRLLNRLQSMDLSTHAPSIRAQRPTKVAVLRVEPAGRREVRSMTTSTSTYVGEGYLHHNSSGYERLYRHIDDTFEWDAPTYETFTPDRFRYLLDVMQSKTTWVTMRDEPLDGLPLIGRFQAGPHMKPVFVYAGDRGHVRVTGVNQKTEVVPYPRLSGPIVPPIRIVYLTGAQLNTLRSLYLSASIIPSGAQVNLAVVDARNALIGAFSFNHPLMLGAVGDMYAMSDFAIHPAPYRRLAKLVVAAMLSHEVRAVLEQRFNQRVRTIGTTAFTKKPVSMKYRGLMDVHSRKADPAGKKTDGRARDASINYIGPAGKWSLADALAWWTQHHGQMEAA